MHAASSIDRVTAPSDQVRQWPKRPSLGFKVAQALSDVAPRGKGWIPRVLGRSVLRRDRGSILTHSGYVLAVEPSTLDTYTSIVRQGGACDPEVLDACKKIMRSHGVFYDIGANVGLITIEVAGSYPMASIIAFEPQPLLADKIALSAKLNDFYNVRVYDVLLGKDDGHRSLYLHSHSIHASVIPRNAGLAGIDCRMHRIDALIERGEIPPPDLIKIDVEGSELDVFRGAARTIRKHAPTIIFEADDNLARFSVSKLDVAAFLVSRHEYKLFGIRSHDMVRIPISLKEDEMSRFRNFLALPNHKLS